MKAYPRRSCVVCRGTDEPKKLLRFVLSAAQPPEKGEAERILVLDDEGMKPGRGAYCHREGDCLRHPKLVDAVVGSLTRRTKGPKINVSPAVEQLRSFGKKSEPAGQENKKFGKQQSKKIRL